MPPALELYLHFWSRGEVTVVQDLDLPLHLQASPRGYLSVLQRTLYLVVDDQSSISVVDFDVGELATEQVLDGLVLGD